MSQGKLNVRTADFIYDKDYIVSGERDYRKLSDEYQYSSARFAVCPIFSTMFSDLRNYPRKQYVMRKIKDVPEYASQAKVSQKISLTSHARSAILGQDRHKFFHSPQVKEATKIDYACFYSKDEEMRRAEIMAKHLKNHENKKVQANFRESSTQTIPWEPPYKVVKGDPELLKLDFLKWGAGLPAGVHEVTIIERARMKRNWERSMPTTVDKKDLKIRRFLIEQISRDEWLFRENEIKSIQDLRLELLEKMLKELQEKSTCRSEKKIRLYADMKLNEKREKIDRLYKDSNREKRRLEFNYKGILARYRPVNVFDLHADNKSELYAPLLRHGVNPKFGHQKISNSLKKYKSQYFGVEHFSTLPRNLEKEIQLGEVKLPGTRLCFRETKWTTPVLKQLHDELKTLQYEEKRMVNLRVEIVHEASEAPTPGVEDCNIFKQVIHDSCIFLQKILRGRAIQLTIFKGRERCRELIDELRTSHALLKNNISGKIRQKEQTKQDQFNTSNCRQQMKMLEASLKKMGGFVAGTMLDFLNKELSRLFKERKIHAMVLLVERERMKREAAEAGRRQKELRRREEHDEIFKQVVKVHQDTVDMYLQDIVTEGMQFASENEATIYLQSVAETFDKDNVLQEDKLNDVQFTEEYVANLIHHFVIPEVEKNIVRQRNKQNRTKYLKAAHEEIYSLMDTAPVEQYRQQKEELRNREKQNQKDDGSYMENLITDEELHVQQEKERKIVEADIRDILNEIIQIPDKIVALKNMIPCEPRVSSTASVRSTLQLEPKETVHGLEEEEP